MKKKILVSCLLLFAVNSFQSCKKECEPAVSPLLVPAVQKIRESAIKSWEPYKSSVYKVEINFSEPINPEFQNFKADSNIVVSCRLKLKNNNTEVLLPYTVITASGDVQSYFYTIDNKKISLFFSSTGAVSPVPTDGFTLNFTKIQL
jgi:hypothetical protein